MVSSEFVTVDPITTVDAERLKVSAPCADEVA